MSQLSLLLPAHSASPARADAETGVKIAWALDGGRPVHISRYSHLRDGAARPELSCLGCTTPVVAVLPRQGRGQPNRQDFFRHKRDSPDCWAAHGVGAMLWNAVLHLHAALDDLTERDRRRLRLRFHCSEAASPWSTALPIFAVACDEHVDERFGAWDRVALSPTRAASPTVPDIRFFDQDREVLRLHLRTPEQPPSAPGSIETLELVLDERIHARAVGWDPGRDPYLPFTAWVGRARWRCGRHS